MHPALSKMKAPADLRSGWLVLQVMITRACSENCYGCTQGSNLAGKPAMMTVDEFETAVKSLNGFPGVVGVFGGQPTLHPKFPEICEVFRAHIPFENRGIWTNALNGYGAVCRETFNPVRSNINVHTRQANYEEFASDWPEAIAARRDHVENGLSTDSVHSPPFVAMQDVIPDAETRWDLISNCPVNQFWSACIGTVPGRGLRAYACELMYAQAALHCDNPEWPDLGTEAIPGWWRQPMGAFREQVEWHCHRCGVPMNRTGIQAIGGDHEEFSPTHEWIARPKAKGRPVELVTIGGLETSDRPATEYLPGTTPRTRV